MPIQIIPASRRSSTGQIIGEALGTALTSGLQIYQQKQKQKQFQQALQNIEGTYSNPDLNEQQRLIQAYQQLASSGHPELAQQLGGQLARLGGQQESFRNKIMAEQQEQNQMAQSFQNIQNLYNNPDLSEEQKVFGVYQELHRNPTLARNLLESAQKPKKARNENIAGQQFSTGYNAILEGDHDALKKVLEDPLTPLPVKQKLTDLRDKQETRKSVQARELRGRQSIVQKSYRQAIENERKKISKDVWNRQPQKEVDRINKNIKRLEALQKSDLKRVTKDPEAYTNLHLWNYVDPEFLPEDEEEMEGLDLIANEAMGEEPQESPEIHQRINFLNSKFSPQEFKDKKKQDKRGRIYQSDGSVWRLVQQ